ncbi:MAG: hypothetical protein Faunusvirus2_9 [Faunusvirus sp.]|jgi:hypothetical protein|uniref:Uncharacterized protein n=1 Tax=Faunusvirus sp. TaxID=2487766 RepID=A0A3G4ZVY5_9VIRU|nr:MAG: hypothetical protein Faunusvirus2_9 [Faunusvirus sp.]
MQLYKSSIIVSIDIAHIFMSEEKLFIERFRNECLLGYTEECKKILEETDYKYINAYNQYGETPILIAIWFQRYELAEILCAHGCDIADAEDNYGWNVLRIAAHRNNINFVKKAIAAGCDINAKNKCSHRHFSPIQLVLRAVGVGQTEMANEIAILLIDKGAKFMDVIEDESLYIEDGFSYRPVIEHIRDKYKKHICAEIDDVNTVIYASFKNNYAIALIGIICEFIV